MDESTILLYDLTVKVLPVGTVTVRLVADEVAVVAAVPTIIVNSPREPDMAIFTLALYTKLAAKAGLAKTKPKITAERPYRIFLNWIMI